MLNASLLNQRLINAGPVLASVSYIGESLLIAEGTKIKGGVAHFVGVSSVTAAGNVRAGGSAHFTGTGQLTAIGGKLQKAAIHFLGNGALNAQALRRRHGNAHFIGEGALSADPIRMRQGTVHFTGESSLQARGIASAFYISADGRFSPLNVLVLGDSRKDLLPAVREYAESIPGRHGDIMFSTKLNPRILELHVATNEGLSPAEREQLKRAIARYLNPVMGTKTLVFADDLDKTFNVKYSGKIDLNQYPTWFDFVIPFKIRNPYIIGTFEQTQVGSGAVINIGTVPAYPIIEIAGPDIDPSLTVGDTMLSYTGAIGEEETLVIDTKKQAATIGDLNVLESYNKAFPCLPPGETIVSAGGNVTFRWKGRWV